MKCVIIALLVCCAFAAEHHQTWEFFTKTHKKVYRNAAEEKERHGIFLQNMEKARELEARNPNAKFGATPYADMTEAEFKIYHNGEAYYKNAVASLKDTPMARMYTPEEVRSTPRKIDWRTRGAVTHVKNQMQCGSCWSFSTTGGIEGQWFLAGHNLTSLSEQELVSCDTIDSGCQGGLMTNAFNWLLENRDGKIVTAESYPYVSGEGNVPACDLTGKVVGAQIIGHEYIYHSEEQMQAWTAVNGPLSVAVDAGMTWQLYFGGVMSDCGQGGLDHGVLIVGYNDEESKPYWIIKNSWGPSWGEQGYLYVEKGSNQCSVTQYPVSAIAKGNTLPPSPPPPTPVQSGYFVHSIFDNSNCSLGEWDLVWRQNECVSWDGVSFKATCGTENLHITAYYESLDCSGPTVSLTERIGSCLQSTKDDVYYTTQCPSGGDLTPKKGAKSLASLKGLISKQLP